MTLWTCITLSALLSAPPALADGHDTAAYEDTGADETSDDTGADGSSEAGQGAADLAGDKGGCGFGESSAAGLLLILGVGASLRRTRSREV